MRYVCALAALLGLTVLLSAKPPVPRPAGEFSCSDPDGKSISLSNYKGKVVLIQFLDTGCPHCQAMSRMLSKLQTEYGPKGFQAFGVAFNEATPDVVRNYVKGQQLNIPVGLAPRNTVIRYLGISVMERLMVPQVMIIDRQGRVQAQSDAGGTSNLQDESYLRDFIGGLLQQSPAPRKTPAH
jgi:peroxiredoxin